ncbi:MAG: adenosylcobinamide-phosphate synthase CbiB [Acidimicrobiales bacterium]
MVVGLGLDRLAGEPPDRWHPVGGFGRLAASAETVMWADSRRRGLAFAAGLTAVAGCGGLFVEALCRRAGGRLAQLGAVGSAVWLVVAGRMLGQVGAEVGRAVSDGDVGRARALLPALVGRDPDLLDSAGICRAVVESVAENSVDAVVAPALWALVAGTPGALAYRAVNTLDAMVGHRDARHRRFGWASARLDDLAGWAPARVTAGLVAAVRPASARRVWTAVRRDAPGHPSPNAGVAEAAFAGALGLSLGGCNSYGGRVERRGPLGDGRDPCPADIARAIRLSTDVTLLLGLVGVVVAAAARRPGTAQWIGGC